MTQFHYVLRHSAKRTAILISLLVASPLAAQQAQVVFSPPQNVSSNPGASYYPRVAVDSQGSINIVWLDQSPGYNAVFFSRSTDGGATFSTPQNLSNSPAGSSSPHIAMDSGGNINVVWVDNTPSNYQIFFSGSIDRGATFSTPMNISNDPRGADYPYMTVDSDDNINVAWVVSPRVVPSIIFFSRSSDGGVTFSAPIALSTKFSFGPQVAVDSAGNINIVWVDGFNNFDVAFSRSSDGGATFTAPKVISSHITEAGPDTHMVLDSKGNIYAVWDTQPYGNVYLSRSSDGGATFSDTTLTNNTHPSGPKGPQMAIDSSDNINVVWTDSGDIFFSRSSDGGATFSTPQNLSNNLGVLGAAIATDPSGNINVFWLDHTPGNWDIFFTRSSDGGSTFSTPENLSNDSGNSSPLRIATDPSGNINVVWQDNTPGNDDIFFTRSVSLSALSLDPSTVTGGGSSTGTVTLTAPAPSDRVVVSLSSSNTGVANVPSSVTVPGGSTTATFPVTTNPVDTSTAVTISGSYGGDTQAATLTVTPPTLTSLTLSSSSVIGGPLGSTTGTVTLSAPAPAGTQVVLSSSNPSVASVPTIVAVPAGATSATFTVHTSLIIGSTTVRISGSYNDTTRSANLTVSL